MTTTLRWWLVVGVAVGGSLLPARPGGADTINFMNVGKNAVVEIHSPALGDVSVRAGELNWGRAAGTAGELALLFYAYCVDPNNWVRVSQTVAIQSSDDLTWTGVPDAGGKVAWLVNTYAPQVHDTGTNIQAAALQVAVWTALFNRSGSPTEGPFRLRSTGPVLAHTQAFLDALYSAPGPGGYFTSSTTWLNAAAGQDQMIPTPEPGSLLLLGSGLAAAWRLSRRKRD